MPIHAQLFLPPGGAPGAKHPALVFMHGGSRRQMLLGWHYMDYYNNAYAHESVPGQPGLRRALHQLSQRHRLRAQLPRGDQLRRERRQRVQRCGRRRPLPAHARRCRSGAHRPVGRVVRRLPDRARPGARVRPVRRRRGFPRRPRLECARQPECRRPRAPRATMPRARRSNRRPWRACARGARRCC